MIAAASGPSAVGQLVREARAVLAAAGVEQARLEAEVLLAHLLSTSRAWLWAHPEAEVGPQRARRYRSLARRRAAGEPSAYLTGVREFWSLSLTVDPRVLIPRPETEHVVETALRLLPTDRAPRLADVGTGSGCIALALARERTDAVIIGIDVSAAALQVAADNVRGQAGGDRVLLLQADGLEAVGPGTLDGVVSNPPYIPDARLAILPREVRDWEPRAALTPGGDGLSLTRRIIATSVECVRPGGFVAIEIDPASVEAVLALVETAGWRTPSVTQDLEGRPRVVAGRRLP